MEQSIWAKKWVIGNWKMNGETQANAELLEQLKQLPAANQVCIGIAPPAIFLSQLYHTAQSFSHNHLYISAQDVSRFAENGAYTGEISAKMLKNIGVELTLVGHSERNLYFGEQNETRRLKLENALNAGLLPILCVGESLAEREAGREQEVVAHQLSILKQLPSENYIVAYEPVWAIGTGKTANREQIAQMHQFIYQEILSLVGNDANIRILYGGSVNEHNAAEIFNVPHVDGALVGGASLKYHSFSAIINAAQETI